MIRVRVVADTLAEAEAAASAIADVLDVASTSRAYPRRSGDGISIYQRASLRAQQESAQPAE